MKHVTKGVAPQEFEDWKSSANENWTPSYADFRNPEKQDLHCALLAEQGFVCCYCGQRTSLANSHIEHFRPQESRLDLTLAFDNLLASCIRETKPSMPLHCGHAKGSEFDEALHVSPLEPGCEGRFQYTLDGHIEPTDVSDVKAGHMLRLLKLDIAFLKNRREAVVRQVFDAEFLVTATDDELKKLRSVYLGRDEGGRAESLGHVLARFAEQRLQDTRATWSESES